MNRPGWNAIDRRCSPESLSGRRVSTSMVRSASSQFVDPTEDRDNVTEVQLPPWDASRFRGRLAAARLPPNLSSKLEAGPFVSNAIAERIHVEALNDISGWGPSDHCRIRIEVTGPA